MPTLRASSARLQVQEAEDWPAWTDEERWVPTEEDAQWASENLNDDWHDLDGHPTDHDDMAADEAAYREDEARRFAADPTDDELNRWADEAEAMSMMERGLWPF